MLKPWRISAINLPARKAIGFLASCMGHRTLASGIILGSDITYWTLVLRFAGSLVAREKFIPGLGKKQGGYHAVWEPLPAG